MSRETLQTCVWCVHMSYCVHNWLIVERLCCAKLIPWWPIVQYKLFWESDLKIYTINCRVLGFRSPKWHNKILWDQCIWVAVVLIEWLFSDHVARNSSWNDLCPMRDWRLYGASHILKIISPNRNYKSLSDLSRRAAGVIIEWVLSERVGRNSFRDDQVSCQNDHITE